MRILERQNIVIEGSERAIGAVLHAFVKRVDDAVFEVGFSWKGGDDGLALRIGERVVIATGYVHACSRLNQLYLGAHEFRYAGRRVERDRIPDRFNIAFANPALPEKVPRGVGAI